MAIRSRDILKDWFKRGKYPLESQFADWIDSFVHLGEDSIPITGVDGLANQLNEKFDRNTGQALAGKFAELQSKVNNYTGLTDQLKNVAEHFRVEEADDESDFDLDSYTRPGYYFLVVMSDGRIAWHRMLVVEESDWYDDASTSDCKQYSQTMFAPDGFFTRQGHYGYVESDNGDHVYSLTWDQWMNLSDGVKVHEKRLVELAGLLEHIRFRLTSAEGTIVQVANDVSQFRTLTFANPEEFAARDAELLPEAGIYRIDYTGTEVVCPDPDVPVQESVESEYMICVAGNKIHKDQPQPEWNHMIYDQSFLQIRLSRNDISYRTAFVYFHEKGVGYQDKYFDYVPNAWQSLRGSKLDSDLTWLEPAEDLAPTDMLPVQHHGDGKASVATLEQLRAFLTSGLSDFMNYEPDDSTTELKPGVYVCDDGSAGGGRCVMSVSCQDGPSRNVGGQRRFNRSYHCVRLSGSGFEYRNGMAYGLASASDVVEIRWEEWASLYDVIASKAAEADLSPVMGEYTSLEGDDELELRTGFTREDMKMDLFIDLWNEECVTYPKEFHPKSIGAHNKSTGLFDIGSLSLTYQEALAVVSAGRYEQSFSRLQSVYTNNTDIRVNLPKRSMGTISIDYPFYYCTKLEVANAFRMIFLRGIYGCPNIRVINDIHDVQHNNVIADSPTIEELTIEYLSHSLNLSNQPKISIASFQQIVSHAVNTTPITITVHPDVFAKLTDETNTEWHKVLTDAADKNIQFATI